jgi:hypothetical protein
MKSLHEKYVELETLINRLALGSREVDRAMRASLNQTIRQVVTLTARGTAKETKTKVALIRNRMKVLGSKRSNRAKISALTYAMPAIILGQPRVVSSGVSVGGHFYKEAFVRFAERKRGRARNLIFRRTGAESHPLHEMRIPMQGAFDRNFAAMEASLKERLLKNFERQIKLLGGLFR